MKIVRNNSIMFENREEVQALMSCITLYQNVQQDLGESQKEILIEQKGILEEIFSAMSNM